MADHYTVLVSIHKVTAEQTKPGTTVRCRCMGPCDHAKPELKRVDGRVVNVETRVDGSDMAALDLAINKAIKHLDCERPASSTEPINVAERLGYPK